MPALLTHDCFGNDVWNRVGDSLFCPTDDETRIQELRRAFLIGNQGPDPFFFALRTPHLVASKRFGSLMHHEKVDETIEAFRRLADYCPEPSGSLLLAYVLGFLCHFTLDSTVHPFVYAQQYAICDAGVKGLDRRDGSVVHGQIEADLDMILLRQRRGTDIRAYNYTRDVLKLSDETLAFLDVAYQALAHEVYAVNLTDNAFSRGVEDMRLTIGVLYSPHGIKRRLIGAFERLFRRHSLAQALSPRADADAGCDFDNHERQAWTNPFTGVVSSASFNDLYAEALDAALVNITALMDGKPVADITGGLDFEGAFVRI
jgi:hypothetical protein